MNGGGRTLRDLSDNETRDSAKKMRDFSSKFTLLVKHFLVAAGAFVISSGSCALSFQMFGRVAICCVER